MQKVGDVCDNCYEKWEKKGKEPLTLQRLGGSTLLKKMIVPACPHCDGDALSITNFGNHEPLEEA